MSNGVRQGGVLSPVIGDGDGPMIGCLHFFIWIVLRRGKLHNSLVYNIQPLEVSELIDRWECLRDYSPGKYFEYILLHPLLSYYFYLPKNYLALPKSKPDLPSA